MPLPPSSERRPLHHRLLDLRGYERADGLFDIEGRLVDTKSYPFDNRWRGRIEPGEPVHDMMLRLTVDEDLVVRRVEAVMDAAPFDLCPAITAAFGSLAGLRIGPGFNREVRRRVGGIRGCTHLVELLPALATVAIQTIAPIAARRRRQRGEPEGDAPPAHLDGCHALRRDGPVVRTHFPRWYRPVAEGEGALTRDSAGAQGAAPPAADPHPRRRQGAG